MTRAKKKPARRSTLHLTVKVTLLGPQKTCDQWCRGSNNAVARITYPNRSPEYFCDDCLPGWVDLPPFEES